MDLLLAMVEQQQVKPAAHRFATLTFRKQRSKNSHQAANGSAKPSFQKSSP